MTSTNVDQGLLIELIQSHSHLYDMKSKYYKDMNMKDNTWQEIAVVLETEASECKRFWKNLRDRFSKEKRMLRSGDSQQECEWVYYNKMLFYAKHCTPRKTITATPATRRTRTSEDERPESGQPFYSDDNSSVVMSAVPGTWKTEASEEADLATVLPPEKKRHLNFSPPGKLVQATKKKSEQKDVHEILQLAKQITNHMSTPATVNETFAKYIAARLNEMDADEAKAKRQTITAIIDN